MTAHLPAQVMVTSSLLSTQLPVSKTKGKKASVVSARDVCFGCFELWLFAEALVRLPLLEKDDPGP